MFLLEKIGAVTGDSGNFVAEIDVERFFENFNFSFWRDFVNHRLELIVLERGIIDAD